MGVMTEVVKALCTESGKSLVKNVATGVLSIMIAKAIVDTNKVNQKINNLERDLDRAEMAIDEALGRSRRDRYEEMKERERYYQRSKEDRREFSDERPRRYTGRRR